MVLSTMDSQCDMPRCSVTLDAAAIASALRLVAYFATVVARPAKA